jgi:threonine/homoserine/homoserine lactone efflux protein
VHDVEGMIWFTALITAVHRVRRWLSKRPGQARHGPRHRTVLIAFGLKLAFSRS